MAVALNSPLPHRPKHKWNEQTRSQVCTYLAQNMPIREISEKTNVPERIIKCWKKEELLLSQPGRGRKWDEETCFEVFSSLMQNTPIQDISRKTGVPGDTIRNWRRKELPHIYSGRRCSWDEETRSQVFTYLMQDMPVSEIWEKTGVPPSTIRLWKRKL